MAIEIEQIKPKRKASGAFTTAQLTANEIGFERSNDSKSYFVWNDNGTLRRAVMDPNVSGWTPVLAVVSDGERRVLQITDWTGGTGVKPSVVNQFIGATGIVSTMAAAVNIRGSQGAVGPTGAQGIQGNPGTPGAQGEQGPIGPVGPAGLNWQGLWSDVTAYVENDAVGYNGASYFCVAAVTGGGAPDVNSANWALLAAQGAQGPIGPVGPIGPKGDQGDTGPQGAQGPIGPAGQDGAVGPAGPQGEPGADGRTVWNGTAVPLSDIGITGDFYIKTDTWQIYGPKDSNQDWGTPSSLIGPQGLQGPAGTNGTDGNNGIDGKTILSGDGAPDAGVGVAGDFYIDKTAWNIYGPKTTEWGSPVSLIGPQGPTGPTGVTGADGRTVLNGNGIPSEAVGVAGDFYIDTQNWLIYGPKTTTWGSPSSLVGPAGANGTNGSNGSNGASAYAIAVTNGFIGTEAEWLASLIGDTGATGATGPAGVVPQWDTASSYTVNQIVQEGQNFYVCILNANDTTNAPSVNTTNWSLITVPVSGTPGNVLTKTAGGYVWQAPTGGSSSSDVFNILDGTVSLATLDLSGVNSQSVYLRKHYGSGTNVTIGITNARNGQTIVLDVSSATAQTISFGTILIGAAGGTGLTLELQGGGSTISIAAGARVKISLVVIGSNAGGTASVNFATYTYGTALTNSSVQTVTQNAVVEFADISGSALTSLNTSAGARLSYWRNTVTGNATIATSVALGSADAGRRIYLDVLADTTPRTLTFPTGSEMMYGSALGIVVPASTRMKFLMFWNGSNWTVNYSTY